MNKVALEWIDKAEKDILVARREFRLKPPEFNAVCFHSQQCVEKYLKAILQEKGISSGKTHDLNSLISSCLEYVPKLFVYRKVATQLSTFAVEVRYPGFEAGKAEAKMSLETAENIRTLVRKHFSL